MELDLIAQGQGGMRCLSDSPDIFGDAYRVWTESNESLPAVAEGRSATAPISAPCSSEDEERLFGMNEICPFVSTMSIRKLV